MNNLNLIGVNLAKCWCTEASEDLILLKCGQRLSNKDSEWGGQNGSIRSQIIMLLRSRAKLENLLNFSFSDVFFVLCRQ